MYPRADGQGEHEAEIEEYLKKVQTLSIRQFDQQKLDQQERNLRVTVRYE
jgi:hypothetical protein